MINPIATTCIATSFVMPNKLQARGINKSEPPATPEAPQAEIADTMHSKMAVGKSTSMPKVWVVARVNTEIVMAAPAILTVAPSGIDTE